VCVHPHLSELFQQQKLTEWMKGACTLFSCIE